MSSLDNSLILLGDAVSKTVAKCIDEASAIGAIAAELDWYLNKDNPDDEIARESAFMLGAFMSKLARRCEALKDTMDDLYLYNEPRTMTMTDTKRPFTRRD